MFMGARGIDVDLKKEGWFMAGILSNLRSTVIAGFVLTVVMVVIVVGATGEASMLNPNPCLQRPLFPL